MAGYVAPDGRPPQAPGVGKDSKRHDLEAPATPGVRSSDMRQGDRQMLEAGQKVAPRPKKSAPRGSAGGGAPAAAGGGGMQVPDAIEFASGRIGGNAPAIGEQARQVDPTPWMPLVRQWALRPNSGGALAANYYNMLTQFVQRPLVPRANFVDYNEMDEIIAGEL